MYPALNLLLGHIQSPVPQLPQRLKTLQPGAEPIEQGAYWLLQALFRPPPEVAQGLLLAPTALTYWLQALTPEQEKILRPFVAQFCRDLALQPGIAEPWVEALLQRAQHLDSNPAQDSLARAQRLLQQSQFQVALSCLENINHSQPEFWPAWSLRAQCLVQLERSSEAVVLFEALNDAQPQNPELQLILANLYQLQALPLKSLRLYQSLLNPAPSHWSALQRAGLWNNLGRLKMQQGDVPGALEAFDKAILLGPELVEARLNAARLFLREHQIQSAANLLFPVVHSWQDQRPLTLSQRDALCLYVRILRFSYRSVESEKLMQSLLRCLPRRHFWHFQALLGNPEGLFLTSAETQNQWARETLDRLNQADFQAFEIQHLQEEITLLPECFWGLHYLNHLDARLQLQVQRKLNSFYRCVPGPTAPPKKNEVLRLGILVSEGHEGIFKMQQGGLMMGLPEELVVPILIGKQARLPGCEHPAMERVELPDDVLLAVDSIRQLDLDLLYYWEVGSDVINYFLPFFRLAPVQMTSIGTPASSGHPGIDIYLCPEQIQVPCHSERLWPLKLLPGYYENSAERCSHLSPEVLGLPEGPLLLCLQNPLKLSRAFFEGLDAFLAREPDITLVLLKSQWPWIQAEVEAYLAAWPRKHQLHWVQTPLSRGDYLSLIQAAHVVIDTPGFNGFQSNLDALAMGKPILTLSSTQSIRAQFGRVIVSQLGCPELCLTNATDFWQTLTSLFHEPEKYQQLCEKIKNKQPQLFENAAAIHAFAHTLWDIALEYGLRQGPPGTR